MGKMIFMNVFQQNSNGLAFGVSVGCGDRVV